MVAEQVAADQGGRILVRTGRPDHAIVGRDGSVAGVRRRPRWMGPPSARVCANLDCASGRTRHAACGDVRATSPAYGRISAPTLAVEVEYGFACSAYASKWTRRYTSATRSRQCIAGSRPDSYTLMHATFLPAGRVPSFTRTTASFVCCQRAYNGSGFTLVAQSWRDTGAFRGERIDARRHHQRAPTGRAERGEQRRNVALHRAYRDDGPLRDLGVGEPLAQQHEHVARSRRGPEALAIARHSSEPRIRRSVATTDASPVSDPQYEPIVRSVVNIPIRSASSAQSTIACACLEGG